MESTKQLFWWPNISRHSHQRSQEQQSNHETSSSLLCSRWKRECNCQLEKLNACPHEHIPVVYSNSCTKCRHSMDEAAYNRESTLVWSIWEQLWELINELCTFVTQQSLALLISSTQLLHTHTHTYKLSTYRKNTVLSFVKQIKLGM